MLVFTSSVGDTTWTVYNLYWARQVEIMTLNKIFTMSLSLYKEEHSYDDKISLVEK